MSQSRPIAHIHPCPAASISRPSSRVLGDHRFVLLVLLSLFVALTVLYPLGQVIVRSFIVDGAFACELRHGLPPAAQPDGGMELALGLGDRHSPGGVHRCGGRLPRGADRHPLEVDVQGLARPALRHSAAVRGDGLGAAAGPVGLVSQFWRGFRATDGSVEHLRPGGIIFVLAVTNYPFVFITVARGAAAGRSEPGGGRSHLGRGHMADHARHHAAAGAPGDLWRRPAGLRVVDRQFRHSRRARAARAFLCADDADLRGADHPEHASGHGDVGAAGGRRAGLDDRASDTRREAAGNMRSSRQIGDAQRHQARHGAAAGVSRAGRWSPS
jgi:hypothetical protein